jgi:chitinase
MIESNIKSREISKRKNFIVKRIYYFIILSIIFSSNLFANDSLWVTGYIPSYHQSSNGSINILSDADYNKLTHLSHHGPYVKQDGSFSYAETVFSDIKAQKAVEQAHQHGIPIMLCIVAWYDNYIEAINDSVSRNRLIINTLKLVDWAGYDGVDVDLEPVMSAYISAIKNGNPHYVQFINQLYDSLQVRTSALLGRPLLLTAPMNGYAGKLFSQIHEKFDQINIMTYDMVSPDWGFPVWHDSPVYSAGYMLYGKPAPSVEEEVKLCLSPGVPAQKVGIGVSYDAFRWRGGTGTTTGGVTMPRQHWQTAPSWTRFSYKDMMANHYDQQFYRWDDGAKMSYMSKDREGSSNDEFWSYNDENSCKEKVKFVKQQNLGGVIIWELGSGYIWSNPVGNRQPQLNAIYEAKTTPLAVNDTYDFIPEGFMLYQNYPNPFNPSTKIVYSLPFVSNVKIQVFNLLGEVVAILEDKTMQPGTHSVEWDASNLSSSVYLCRIDAEAIYGFNGFISVRKMILAK